MKRSFLPQVVICVVSGLPAAVNAQSPYRIPVVVHVVHDDGNENISDAQVRNGIEILTRNWRKQNPDTVEIAMPFKPIAADMEVEFELARLDPDGQCTNGINRLRSALTTSGTHAVKELIHWPRDKYLNVYVVRNAAGLAGHALMPFQADSIPEKDGIVIQGSYFGNIGTSNDVRSMVLSHEVGHYFNLYHIWGGNNVPGFYYLPVGQQANCEVGDEVDDTPATIGWSTCNLSAASCDGTPDNVQNFMDYSYCGRMFTEGQKARVHAALNSPVAQRNNLWSAQNLQATGLGEPATLCKADFRGRRIWCVGEEVTLTDASYHGATEWTWDLGNGTQQTGASPVFTYASSGIYDVGLTVGNGTTTINTTKERFLYVLPVTGQPGPYVEGFEGIADITGSSVFTECEDVPCMELASVGATGSASVRIPNNGAPMGRTYALTSPRLDLTGITQPVIRFKYAFARRDTTNTDRLLVRISRDCGKTWFLRRTILPADLPTVANTVQGAFVPGPGDWTHVSSIIIPQNYATDNLLVRIEFISGGGNDLYIDDINIDSNTVIGIDELEMTRWQLAPNPTYDIFRIDGPMERQDVTILSVTGEHLRTLRNVPSGGQVSVGDLATGTYFVRLTAPGVAVTRRLVVMR
jgi:hypothetical protein